MLNIVDEAQDIFQGSRAIRESASSSINEIVRKGRSKQIGFVFALQSVTQLPNSILIAELFIVKTQMKRFVLQFRERQRS